MTTYLIMSGVSSCPDMDEIHGTAPDLATAEDVVLRLNAAGHRLGGGTHFFVTPVGEFPGVDHPDVRNRLKGDAPASSEGLPRDRGIHR